MLLLIQNQKLIIMQLDIKHMILYNNLIGVHVSVPAVSAL